MDVIQRVEPVVTELERGRESIAIVGHQAVLRAVWVARLGRLGCLGRLVLGALCGWRPAPPRPALSCWVVLEAA
jgi:broad specificity phosphatase PhoE